MSDLIEFLSQPVPLSDWPRALAFVCVGIAVPLIGSWIWSKTFPVERRRKK